MGMDRGLTTKTLLVRKDFLEAQAKVLGEGKFTESERIIKMWNLCSPHPEPGVDLVVHDGVSSAVTVRGTRKLLAHWL